MRGLKLANELVTGGFGLFDHILQLLLALEQIGDLLLQLLDHFILLDYYRFDFR